MFKNALTNLICPDDRDVFVTTSGEKDRPNYKRIIGESGCKELVRDGVIHSYEEIQSWKNTTDMSAIMERYIRTGDSSILQQRAGFYGDVTSLPKNYVELHNTLINADNFFNALPIDLKKQFDNNPALFYANNENVMEVVNGYFTQKVDTPTDTIVGNDPAPIVLPDINIPVEGGFVNE